MYGPPYISKGAPIVSWATDRALLVPNLDFVAIQITYEGVRHAWRKFASGRDGAASAINGLDRSVNVLGARQTKPKVNDATDGSGVGRAVFAGENVVGSGSQHLHGGAVPKALLNAEYRSVERYGPI